MAFLANNKFKEILNASRNGNEKAKMIMQAMRKGQSQDDLNRLVDDYYGIGEESVEPEPESTPDAVEEPQNEPQAETDDAEPTEQVTDTDKEILDEPEADPNDLVEMPSEEVEEATPIDIAEVLKTETDGLFDEDEYNGVSFSDFLKRKKSDANRAMKNADYFKAFDVDGRGKYADGLVDAYRQKFDGNLRDIERGYEDNDRAIATYLQSTNDMLDDGVAFGMESATNAYNDLIGDDKAMGAFGRYWDDNDSSVVVTALKELVNKYGKENVISALNVLKDDNNAHRDYLNNSIDANISKYTKGVYGLLK